jgi:hypothetical protein
MWKLEKKNTLKAEEGQFEEVGKGLGRRGKGRVEESVRSIKA